MRLTRDQRAAFFAGDCPALKGDGKAPIEPGHVYRLSAKLHFKVTNVRIRKARPNRREGWSLDYIVYDSRDPARLLRRTPSIHFEDWRAADKHRTMTPAEREAWEADAAEDSAYAAGGHSTIADAGEAVDSGSFARESEQDRIARRLRYAQEIEERSLAARVHELERLSAEGEDVHRQLAAIRRRVEAAERKLRRAAA